MDKIALPIETKVRELDGKLWLGLNLVTRNYEVVLGPSDEIINNLDKIKPDYYISKDTGDGNANFFNLLQKSGVIVLGLDTEGGVYTSADKYAKNKQNFLNYIDGFFAWGHNPKNALKRNYNNSNNIYVTGNPRFDLLQPHLRFIYQNRAIPFNKRYGEYILVNGNFSFANPYAQHVVNKNEEIYGSAPQSKRTYANRTFYRFIDAIYHLQHKFPETNIIIRPHPSENNTTYKEAFEGYDHIHIEDAGDARTWIAGASVTLHHDCTTGIESALMGVPVVSYRPFQNEEYEMELPQRVSEQVFTLEELTEYVSQSLHTDQPYELDGKQTEYLKQYFHNIDGSAAENICDIVDSLGIRTEKNYNKLKPDLRGKVERRAKSSRWSNQMIAAYEGVQKFRGYDSQRKQRQYLKQKFPGLEKEEIFERVNEINSVLDIGPVSVEQAPMTNDTFYIRPE